MLQSDVTPPIGGEAEAIVEKNEQQKIIRSARDRTLPERTKTSMCRNVRRIAPLL